jgi:glutathione S-transferase
VGDAVVGEADVMSQYLEEAFPESGTPLLPKDALGRSRVRHLIKEMNGGKGVSAMYVEEEEEEGGGRRRRGRSRKERGKGGKNRSRAYLSCVCVVVCSLCSWYCTERCIA